jgi:hypothetical protein
MQVPLSIALEESTVIPSLMNLNSADDIFNDPNIKFLLNQVKKTYKDDKSLMNLLQNAEIIDLKDWCYKNDSARA